MNRLILAAGAAALLTGGASVLAQTTQVPAPLTVPGAQPAARAQVAQEVQAMFARLDSNRDGFVTREEARQGRGLARELSRGDRARHRAERRAMHARSPQRIADRGAMFDRMDANRDGMISRDEFARAPLREEHRVVVRNGSGEDVRVREIADGVRARRGPPGLGLRTFGARSLRGRMFDMVDGNRDGRVSLQEATDAAYRRFDMSDLNRDGRLTAEERRQAREQRRAQRQRS